MSPVYFCVAGTLPSSMKREISERGTRTARPKWTHPSRPCPIHARMVFGFKLKISAACGTVRKRSSILVGMTAISFDYVVKFGILLVDMEYRFHTDAPEKASWCRCRSVRFDGDVVTWELSPNGEYDFVSFYAKQPHRELIEAVDDAALRVFMKRWGPLRRLTSGSDSVKWYRKQRHLLTATARILASIDRRPEQRAALLSLLQASDDRHDPFNSFLRTFGSQIGVPIDPEVTTTEDLKEWCEGASAAEIENICVRFVAEFPLTSMPRFVVKRTRRGYNLRAALFINNLIEALWWMLWQDVFQGAPIQFCQECSGLIVQESKHQRKFCEGACAKKSADRTYAKRKRAKLKKMKQLAKRGGKS